MAGLLSNFRNTLILSLLLAGVMIFAFGRTAPGGVDISFWQAVARWGHVGCVIRGSGLIDEFNFVQFRVLPSL
ncbi:MAG: hypothetical protein ACK5R8_01100, partial [Brevundimonas sp.]